MLTISANSSLKGLEWFNNRHRDGVKIDSRTRFILSPGLKKLTLLRHTGLFQRCILNYLGLSERKQVNDLYRLKDLFTALKGADLSEESKKTITTACAILRTLYASQEGQNSVESIAYQHDILEAFAVVCGKDGLNASFGLDIQRIQAPVLIPQNSRLKSHHIPLIKLSALSALTAAPMQAPLHCQLHHAQHLQGELLSEKIKFGWLVAQLYKHRRIGNFFTCLTGAIITKLVARRLHKPLPIFQKRSWAVRVISYLKGESARDRFNQHTRLILAFFQEMQISPGTEHNGQLYAYSEIFEKPMRQEKTLDEAFRRDLNAGARKMIMQKAQAERRKIRALIGDMASPVVANSYCRLRVLNVPKNGVNTPFSITGKSLSDQNELDDSAARGYETHYQFTVQEMLGISKTLGIQASEYGSGNLTAHQAELEYRKALARLVDTEDAMMVVQRLAPSDVHHFIEPVGARVLHPREAYSKIQNMLSAAVKGAGAKALTATLEQLSATSSSVDVRGSRLSVATPAVRHKSPLSQNDRKIMLVEHEDGSIAIHTFIGAVGINNVAIEMLPGVAAYGANIGAMGAGNDAQRNQWPTLEDSIRVDQEGKGAFALSGSTVVSLYFKKDFVPSQELIDAAPKLKYHLGRRDTRTETIELKANMGDVIGLPTRYAAVQELFTIYKVESWDALKEELLGLNLEAILAQLPEELRDARGLSELLKNKLELPSIALIS